MNNRIIALVTVALLTVTLSGCATTMHTFKQNAEAFGHVVKEKASAVADRFKGIGYTQANLYPDKRRGRIFEQCVAASNHILVDAGMPKVKVVPYGERTTFNPNSNNDARGLAMAGAGALVSAALAFSPSFQTSTTIQGSYYGSDLLEKHEKQRIVTKQRFVQSLVRCIHKHKLGIPPD